MKYNETYKQLIQSKVTKNMFETTSSLTLMVSRSFKVEKDSEQFDLIYQYSLSYLTKGITAFAYQDLMRPFCKSLDFSAKDFRLRLHESRYTSLNLKLFYFRLARVKSVTLDIAKELAGELDIKITDANRMLRVWKSNPGFRLRLKQGARSIERDRLDLLTEPGLNNFFQEIYPDVFRYIKYLSFKKLDFIARSSNVEHADLHSDLFAKVVQAYYSLVPIYNMTDLYVSNYLKRVAHNHAINMIKTETSLKRGRLVNVGTDKNKKRVFSLLMVSENQMALTDGVALPYDEVRTISDRSAEIEKFELEFSISEIMTKLKNNSKDQSKKIRFLNLLMGKEDPEFTKWLQQRKVLHRDEDNVDLQNRLSTSDFNRLVSRFLHLAENTVNVFMIKLRRDLALPEVLSSRVKLVEPQLRAA